MRIILLILLIFISLLPRVKGEDLLVTPTNLVDILCSGEISIDRKKAMLKLFRKRKLLLNPSYINPLLTYIEKCSNEDAIQLAPEILSLIPLSYPAVNIHSSFTRSASRRIMNAPECAGLLFSLAWKVAQGRLYGYDWEDESYNIDKQHEKLKTKSIKTMAGLIKKKSPVVAFVDLDLVGYGFDKTINELRRKNKCSIIEERVLDFIDIFSACKNEKRIEAFYEKLYLSPGTFGLFTDLLSTKI